MILTVTTVSGAVYRFIQYPDRVLGARLGVPVPGVQAGRMRVFHSASMPMVKTGEPMQVSFDGEMVTTSNVVGVTFIPAV